MEKAPALLSAAQPLVGCIERHPHSSQTFTWQPESSRLGRLTESSAAAVSADG